MPHWELCIRRFVSARLSSGDAHLLLQCKHIIQYGPMRLIRVLSNDQTINTLSSTVASASASLPSLPSLDLPFPPLLCLAGWRAVASFPPPRTTSSPKSSPETTCPSSEVRPPLPLPPSPPLIHPLPSPRLDKSSPWLRPHPPPFAICLLTELVQCFEAAVYLDYAKQGTPLHVALVSLAHRHADDDTWTSSGEPYVPHPSRHMGYILHVMDVIWCMIYGVDYGCTLSPLPRPPLTLAPPFGRCVFFLCSYGAFGEVLVTAFTPQVTTAAQVRRPPSPTPLCPSHLLASFPPRPSPPTPLPLLPSLPPPFPSPSVQLSAHIARQLGYRLRPLGPSPSTDLDMDDDDDETKGEEATLESKAPDTHDHTAQQLLQVRPPTSPFPPSLLPLTFPPPSLPAPVALPPVGRVRPRCPPPAQPFLQASPPVAPPPLRPALPLPPHTATPPHTTQQPQQCKAGE